MLECEFSFQSHQIGADGSVHLACILQLLQDLAEKDLNSFGVTREYLLQRDVVFVIYQIRLRFTEPLKKGISYHLRTFARDTKGVRFLRDYTVERDGKIVMEGESHWVLMNIAERKLAAPTVIDVPYPNFPDQGTEVVPKRLRLPNREADAVSVRKVYPSMLDANRHLNNAHFASFLEDAFPERIGKIPAFQIDFIKEAPPFSEVEISVWNEEDGGVISGVFAGTGERCFQAKAEWNENV